MSYETFRKELLSELYRQAKEEVEITRCEVPRNNGAGCEAVILRRREEEMAPVFYLEDFYDCYCEGENAKSIAGDILEQFENEIPSVSIRRLIDSWENAKDRLYPKLVNYEKNRERFSGIPHRRWMDFAAEFYYRIPGEIVKDATVTIRNEHLKLWGVTEEALFLQALENAQRDLPPYFGSLCGLIAGAVKEEAEIKRVLPMYILTNRAKQFGASCLLYPGILERLSRRMKSDFYVLPSSIHECIVVPVSGKYSRESLKALVTEINEKYVHPREVLADEVYVYSREEKRLV